ncbi:hypothetical protein F5B19DRAFT_458887, partial [Rostrohypoxylon terebratum]
MGWEIMLCMLLPGIRNCHQTNLHIEKAPPPLAAACRRSFTMRSHLIRTHDTAPKINTRSIMRHAMAVVINFLVRCITLPTKANMRCMSCMMYAIYAHTVLLMVGTPKSLNRPSVVEAVPLAAREIPIPPCGSDLAHHYHYHYHYHYDVDSMWDSGGAEAPKLRCL